MKAGKSEKIVLGGGMEGYRFIVEGWDFFMQSVIITYMEWNVVCYCCYLNECPAIILLLII